MLFRLSSPSSPSEVLLQKQGVLQVGVVKATSQPGPSGKYRIETLDSITGFDVGADRTAAV